MISLITTTIGRPDKIIQLIESIIRTDYDKPLELVIVCQDKPSHDVINDFIHNYRLSLANKNISTIVLKASPNGASHARNVGAAFATGDMLGFPDDDCTYGCDTLKQIEKVGEFQDLDFLSGIVISENGIEFGKFLKRSAPITVDNQWYSTIESAIFIKKSAFTLVGGFDPLIGPGAKSFYWCHEVNDIAIRLIKYGFKGYFSRDVKVIHPLPFDDNSNKRERRFSPSYSHVVVKNGLGKTKILVAIIRSLAGALIYFAVGRNNKAYRSLTTAIGRFLGLINFQPALIKFTGIDDDKI